MHSSNGLARCPHSDCRRVIGDTAGAMWRHLFLWHGLTWRSIVDLFVVWALAMVLPTAYDFWRHRDVQELTADALWAVGVAVLLLAVGVVAARKRRQDAR
jgi:hypothetical protein